MFTCEVKGLDVVKQMVKAIGEELRPANVRLIMDEAGRVVVQEAKRLTRYEGEIGNYFRQDLGVYRDRRKSAKNAEYVIIGPRFRPYNINQQSQKVAPIAQHMTKGFRQTDRRTRQGFKRGRVLEQENNPVLDAFSSSEGRRNAAINKGVVKYLNKVKRKYQKVLV